MGTRFIRTFASVFTMVLVLQIQHQPRYAPVEWALLGLLAAAYLVFIWLRRVEWPAVAYIGMATLATAATILLQWRQPVESDFAGTYASGLLWPLVWLLASAPQRLLLSNSLTMIPVLAAIGYLNANAVSMPGILVGPLGLYLGVRGITFLKEGNRISKLHLQELHEAHEKLQIAHDELQEAAVHSMRYAALTERSRLARDIHDGIGHHLTSLIVQLQALEMMLPDHPEAAAEQLPVLLRVARMAMSEVRIAAHDWSQAEAGLGLIALKGLIGQTADHSGMKIELECDDHNLDELPLKTNIVLYRVLQEALTNIMKHADAASVEIKLVTRDDRIVLTVADNGSYQSAAGITPGYGIKGMTTRCKEAGGALTYMQNEPHGLIVHAVIPLDKEEAADAER